MDGELTVTEAAKLLGVRRQSVLGRIESGALPARKAESGRRQIYLIPRDAVEEWAAQRAAVESPPDVDELSLSDLASSVSSLTSQLAVALREQQLTAERLAAVEMERDRQVNERVWLMGELDRTRDELVRAKAAMAVLLGVQPENLPSSRS